MKWNNSFLSPPGCGYTNLFKVEKQTNPHNGKGSYCFLMNDFFITGSLDNLTIGLKKSLSILCIYMY